ncbi:MAG: L,D-transpeptidase [Acidimicrobiales bacterium]
MPTTKTNRRPRPAVLAATLLAAVLLLAAGCGSKDRPTLSGDTLSTGSSTTTAEVAAPKACKTLSTGPSLVATAVAEGPLSIYANPGDASPASTLPNPRLINNDPNAKVPLTFLVADFPESTTCDWVQVYLPVRPNGSTGWVRSSDVAFAVNDYRIEVALKAFTLKVFKDGAQTEEIRVGVARDNTPTPGGLYYTTELIKTPNPGGAYGPYAFGLSGFSDTLTTFNGGPGQLGIHGTNEPSAIGTQVSHGCIRMSNDDITRLARILPLGTPVQIDA